MYEVPLPQAFSDETGVVQFFPPHAINRCTECSIPVALHPFGAHEARLAGGEACPGPGAHAQAALLYGDFDG